MWLVVLCCAVTSQRAYECMMRRVVQGAEDVPRGTMSVEAQVARLLEQARDPDLLATMFHGWCAWL